MYLANPSSGAVLDHMATGLIGYIDTPAQGNKRPSGVTWCADNGAYSDRFDEGKWWRFLTANAHAAESCLFATLPDVVGQWQATLDRSLPWIDKVRALGYPVALVLQDGATAETVPWADIDVVFIGGTTGWKLGPEARQLVAEAKQRGLWVHMGRVNSERRFRYASHIGCDSADGTYLTFGPDTNLPKLRAWLRGVNDQGDMFSDVGNSAEAEAS